MSGVTAKGGEEILLAQTVSPVKQGFVKDEFPTPGYGEKLLVTVDFHQSVTLTSQHQEHLSTKDAWELVEKASYPESYQPAPEENLDPDHDELHIQPTISPETDHVSTTDGTTAETVEPSTEHHITERNHVTESLDIPVVNATSEEVANEILNSSSEAHQETELPTPAVDLEHATETETLHPTISCNVSGQPEEVSAGVEMPVMTTSTHTEEPDVVSTTVLPSFDNSTSESHPVEEGSGEESVNPDEETQNPVTHSVVAMETSSSGPVSTPDTSKYGTFYSRGVTVSQLFGLEAAADALIVNHCWMLACSCLA